METIRKVKMHKEFVNPVRWQHTYSGGYQAGRKSTSVVRIQKLTANHVCTNDIGPTRTDFNLGTPRFEITSHSLTTDHKLCDSYNTYTTMEWSCLHKHKNLHRASQLWCSTQST